MNSNAQHSQTKYAGLPEVIKLVRNCAVIKMRQFCGTEAIEFSESSPETPFMKGYWIALILVSGEGLNITIKAHFTTKDVLAFMNYKLKLAEPGIPNPQDFMKEFCNLTAGAVKIELANNNIAVGLSLPVLAREFDNIIAPRNKGTDLHLDEWKLRFKTHEVQITVEIILQKNVKITDTKGSSQAGDVEIL